MITIVQVNASYEIHIPKPGMYMEDIGKTRIEKGKYNVVSNMTKMCKHIQTLSENIHCDELIHHLAKMEKESKWIKDSIDNIQTRRKRGVLGKMLTSIFGVNDEVYQEIDKINQNQQKLIRSTGHQTKFMLTSLTSLNETEQRIKKRLELFQNKINEGLEAVNQMSKWYSTVDTDRLNIQLLAGYQIANNFLADEINQNSNILDILLDRIKFQKMLSPNHLKNIIEEANTKLPSNLEILAWPLLDTKVIVKGMFIKIFGYFPIAERLEFSVLKVTPILIQITNDSYLIKEIYDGIMTVDYDAQLYFESSLEEFKNRVIINANVFYRHQ